MFLGIVLLVIGLAILGFSSDRLVVYAGYLATRLKISQAIIGAVIVGFGTSAPEMAVSGLAAANGDVDLGVGNIIGSNVANTTLVLGIAALISPIVIRKEQLYREFPLCVVTIAGFAVLVQNGINWLEGTFLLVGMVLVLGFLIHQEKFSSNKSEISHDAVSVSHTVYKEILWVAGGILGTVAGAQLLVSGAQRIADELNLGSGFVGLTLVAVGTSLPELVTAVAASRRGMNQLLLGNVLGSNIFNCLAVGGLVGVLGNSAVEDTDLVSLPVYIMLGVIVWAFVSGLNGKVLKRWEASLLVMVWVASLPFVI